MRNFSRNQLPLFIWAAIIFWLSSLTTLPHIKIPIISADKLAHMSVFFVFCWFSRRALFFQTSLPILKRWSLVFAFFLTCLYGYFDEVHQLYVPGRTYDYFDMLADAIGALLFVILFTILDRRTDKQARTS
ncbi:MAG: VanZ family protein [Bacteroidota bacterium]